MTQGETEFCPFVIPSVSLSGSRSSFLETPAASRERFASATTPPDTQIFWRARGEATVPPPGRTHESTLGGRRDGWSRCVRVAMREFPKAMKYASCNGRANGLDLTTYVQRWRLFFFLPSFLTGQAAHLPCKCCLHASSPHLQLWFHVTPPPPHAGISPQTTTAAKFEDDFFFFFLPHSTSSCSSANRSQSSNTSAQFSG